MRRIDVTVHICFDVYFFPLWFPRTELIVPQVLRSRLVHRSARNQPPGFKILKSKKAKKILKASGLGEVQPAATPSSFLDSFIPGFMDTGAKLLSNQTQPLCTRSMLAGRPKRIF